jgi:outer membrane protein assembly factor BamB
VPGLHRPPLRVVLWATATVALLVVATLLWRGSDAAATESTTAAPADVPDGTPAGAVSQAWSAPGDPVPDTVVQGGRVLVGTAHGVRALDLATGEEAWHYTRSNARLCGLAVTNGVAVAVFATANRCDESVALHADTGVRAWTRSLDLAGDAQLSATDSIVLASNPGGIVTLDPTRPTLRWRYHAPGGCRLIDAEAGDTGVAVLEHCAGADGVQLRLFGGFEGEKHWNLDLPVPEADAEDARLLGADGVVTVAIAGEVRLFAPADGALVTRLPAAGGAELRRAGDVALLLNDGVLSALDPATGAPLWTAPAIGLPTASTADKDAEEPASVLVPDADGFVRRDLRTGAELGRSAVRDLPEGGVASSLGPVLVYRLDDRVLSYH